MLIFQDILSKNPAQTMRKNQGDIMTTKKLYRLKKTGMYLLIFIAAASLGISFDFILYEGEIEISEIYSCIILSPLLVPFASAHIPTDIVALKYASGTYGLVYWPIFIWLSIRYFRRVNKVYSWMLFITTFFAYFCIVHKTGSVMSI